MARAAATDGERADAPRKKVERKSADQRSTEIRDAARALALEAGLVAVTLRAIASRIGVVPALVSYHQPNMEQLVADTFRSIVDEELADIVRLTSSGSAAERLRLLIVTSLDVSRDDVTAVWVDAWSIGRRSPALAESVRGAADAWEEHVASIIADGVASGEFREADSHAVAWLLIGIVDGLNAQSVVHSRHDPARIRIVQRTIARELGLDEHALSDPAAPPAG